MFKNLKIGIRLGLCFAIIVSVGLGVALFGRNRLAGLSAEPTLLTKSPDLY